MFWELWGVCNYLTTLENINLCISKMKKTIDIVVPTKWSDVSLKAYQNYISETAGLSDSDDTIITSISTLCNVSADVVKMLKVNDIKEIYKRLSLLVSQTVNNKLFDKVEIGGVKYGFHPNLDEISLGEFVDLDEYSKEGVKGLHYVLSILYRPITEEKGNKYNIEPYNESHIKNARLFEEVSIDLINGAMVFFYHLGSELLTSSKGYLEQREGNNLREVIMGGSAL